MFKQGVGSTVDWKPTLWNYKFHTNKKVQSYSIVNHFMDVSSSTDDTSINFRFTIIDQLNNTDSLSSDDLDDLLLQKEKYLI